MDIEQLAQKYLDFFERKKRESTGKYFYCMKENRPEELHDLVYEIHNNYDLLPNDWIYEVICEAFEAVTDGTEYLDADVYTNDLLEWSKNGYAQSEIAEAIEEFDKGYKDLSGLISYAQSNVKNYILSVVTVFLEDRLEEIEESELEEIEDSEAVENE
jgi:hypothetical protein